MNLMFGDPESLRLRNTGLDHKECYGFECKKVSRKGYEVHFEVRKAHVGTWKDGDFYPEGFDEDGDYGDGDDYNLVVLGYSVDAKAKGKWKAMAQLENCLRLNI